MIIRAIIDKTRPNKNGSLSVKVRISEQGKSVYESLGIYVDPGEFDERAGLFITSFVSITAYC